VKMCFLFGGVFWGIVLVLLGLSIIVRIVFNIHFPFFRILFALIIIYFGLKVLLGGFGVRAPKNTIFFNESNVSAFNPNNDDYNIVFGKGTIDLTNFQVSEKNSRVYVKTAFGAGTIKISSKVPTLIKVTSAFSDARMPDGNAIAFGKYVYKNKSYHDSAACLKVNAKVIFGSLDIIEQ
jgi:predicted membrane protein